MTRMTITKEIEEKRLKDFQMIAESWDLIPEYARGKLDGTISTLAILYGGSNRGGADIKEDLAAG